MTLTEFLLERIADDEAATVGHVDNYVQRERAECEAKRRIVGRAKMVRDSWEAMHGGDPSRAPYPDVNRREKWSALETLHDLAAIYADHPDYQEEWRP